MTKFSVHMMARATVLAVGALVLGTTAGTVPAASAATVSNVSQSISAHANRGNCPTSGSGAAKIIEYYYQGDFCVDELPLRQGNSSFGLTHIQQGGSSHNKTNHETNSYAKSLWQAAINEGSKQTPYPGGSVYTHQYNTPGNGSRRTMCVVADHNNYVYANVNYGVKGIITAFWVNKHLSVAGCNSPDGHDILSK